MACSLRRAFGGIKRRNKVAGLIGRRNRIRVTKYPRGRGERKSCGGRVSLWPYSLYRVSRSSTSTAEKFSSHFLEKKPRTVRARLLSSLRPGISVPENRSLFGGPIEGRGWTIRRELPFLEVWLLSKVLDVSRCLCASVFLLEWPPFERFVQLAGGQQI